MKTQFIQRYLMPGLGGMIGAAAGGGAGGGIGSALAGTTPFGAIAGIGAGLIQSIFGGIRAGRAQRQLENLQSPTYTPNQSIMDYYNKALSRYNVNPQDSALYKSQQRNIQRGVSGAISSLNDRRSALMGLPSILQAQNDATLNAEVAAENEKSQRFGQLGGATEMKAGEDRMAFDINKLKPFERKYNLLAMKAGGANQIGNAGLSNIFRGLQNTQDYQNVNRLYR
jgi:hypothetical protein